MTTLPYRAQNQMFAKVILASKPTNGAPPIFTVHMHYPRPIHGELMTHRVFSRNARSSRAVPVKTMLEEIRNTPFVPWHWGKNQKGMQASEDLGSRIWVPEPNGFIPESGYWFDAEHEWLRARDFAVQYAAHFAEVGYHKQIVNRLIEPFSWIDTLVTSTSWANFFHLRDHADAEPHFRDLAQMVKEAISDAYLQKLEPGQWHMPYTTSGEWFTYSLAECQKLSVARCARISYAPFDGDGSIQKELKRYELLVGSSPLHASPAEHQATPDEQNHFEPGKWLEPHLAGNLGPGWVQFRKTLAGEYVSD